MEQMTEKERKDVQKAVVYDIRLAVDADSKEEYTKTTKYRRRGGTKTAPFFYV